MAKKGKKKATGAARNNSNAAGEKNSSANEKGNADSIKAGGAASAGSTGKSRAPEGSSSGGRAPEGSSSGGRAPEGSSSGGGDVGAFGTPRSWPVYLLLAVLLFGIGAAFYMTWHHEQVIYGELSAGLVGCEESAEVNCDLVNTSAWSEFMGVPVALLAVPTYLVIAFLALFGLRRKSRRAMGYAAAIALLTVLHAAFLFYISKTQLHFVCLWCMRLYAVNASALVLTILAARGSPIDLLLNTIKDLGRWPAPMPHAAGVFFGLLIVCVLGQKVYRSNLVGTEGPGPELKPVATETKHDGLDPDGTLPSKSWQVRTEDKNTATLALRQDDIWKGNPNADVVMVEFADFECGYCKRLSSELKRVYDAYRDRVLFVFRHYPMDPSCNPGVRNRRHGRACLAAQAANCAREQRRFWAFHDVTYKNQHRLDSDALRNYAAVADMDLALYESCMRSSKSKQMVLKSSNEGKALDAHGTPRIFLNGELYRGPRTAESIARQIEKLLGANAREAAVAASGLRNVAEKVEPIPETVPEMRRIEYGSLKFDIDTFEASIEDGKAVSGKGKVPAYRVNWYQAKEACGAAGKRLCTEREWLAACQGALPVDDNNDGRYSDDMIEGKAYPYSDFHKRGACWDGNYRDDSAAPVFTGSFPACISADGVYDLTGNMEEWVGASHDKALLLGGAFDTREDKARCYRPNDTFGAGYAATRTGIRCCRSVE